jgi:PAS domain S-box-containing protein
MLPQDAKASAMRSHSPRTAVDWESHIERLPLATWVCSTDGSDVFLNRDCRTLLGVADLNHVLNGAWTNSLHSDDRDDYMRAWSEFINSSTARFKAQARWVRPDTGQVVPLRVRVQRLNNYKFQGWVQKATAELALSKLEEISYDAL